MAAIPRELKNLRQWTYSYSSKELKRPNYTKYKPNGAMDFEQAKTLAGDKRYVGLYVTPSDPYILIDIDHVNNPMEPESELPPKFLEIFLKHRTYCEISPSGKGIRAIYKLPKTSDKTLVRGNTFYTTELQEKKSIQVSFGPPWNTITGTTLPFAKSKIRTITLDVLATAFNLHFVVQDLETREVKTTFDTTKLPSFRVVQDALFRLKMDQNPRIQRAYKKVTGGEYMHYEYWVKVLMCLHHYATLTDTKARCLDIALAWSATDPTDFDGDDAVVKKWKSFDVEDQGVTFLTLFKIANACKIYWPYPKKRKDTTAPVIPIQSQTANFKALLDFYNLRLHRNNIDPNTYYLTGDRDVLKTWFMSVQDVKWFFADYLGPFTVKSLTTVTRAFAQENGFIGAAPSNVLMFISDWVAWDMTTVDFFKWYLDTEFEDLPEEMKENGEYYDQSTFDSLWNVLTPKTATTTKQKDLYKYIFRKWWLGFLRTIYYDGEHKTNSGILLLTGLEQTYKTSFFRYLLPSFFRREIAFTTHGFGGATDLRDVTKIASASRVVVFDEIEQHFTGDAAESGFKKLLDNESQTFIDKYEVATSTFTPIALYGATSNQNKFRLSSMGMRRLFHIPVSKVDTDAELKLCWHAVLRDLKTEYDRAIDEGRIPWNINPHRLNELTNANITMRAETNLDTILDEVWAFDTPFDYLKGVTNFQHDGTHRLMTPKNIVILLEEYGTQMHLVTPAALKKSLERMCSTYTGTIREDIPLSMPKCLIHLGQTKQHPYTRWVMPPLRDEALSHLAMFLTNLKV